MNLELQCYTDTHTVLFPESLCRFMLGAAMSRKHPAFSAFLIGTPPPVQQHLTTATGIAELRLRQRSRETRQGPKQQPVNCFLIFNDSSVIYFSVPAVKNHY